MQHIPIKDNLINFYELIKILHLFLITINDCLHFLQFPTMKREEVQKQYKQKLNEYLQ